MATAAYIDKHRHVERHVSMSRLTLLLTNVAIWAALIVGLGIVVR